MLTACTPSPSTNTITLDPNGKEPYGTYLFHKSLPYYFPKTQVHTVNANYDFSTIGNSGKQSLIVCIGLQTHFTPQESQALFEEIWNGAVLLTSSTSFDSLFQQKMGFTIAPNAYGDAKLTIVKQDNEVLEFTATHELGAPLLLQDSLSKATKGYYNNFPNVLLYKYGKGRILIHSNPLEFTNISMLGNNKRYVESLLGMVNQQEFKNIYLSSFINHDNRVTDFEILWTYKSFRWAATIGGILMLIFLLFESKRRQLPIPIPEPSNNNPLTFVQTIAQLHYSKRDLNNLAQKKFIFFFEMLRTKHLIDTRKIDEDFSHTLHNKTNIPSEEVDALLSIYQKLEANQLITQDEIFKLDAILKKYYHGRKHNA